MLLRIAIGWHFLYEGFEKVESTRRGGKPFTAESYLRFSTGPFAPYFRGMVPDVNGREKLDADRLKAAWRSDVDRIINHYHFVEDQRVKAQAALDAAEDQADLWFQDRDNLEKRKKYFDDLGEVQRLERKEGAPSYERERASAKRRELDADRRGLIKDLDARGDALRKAVLALAAPEQVEASGPYHPPHTELEYINYMTMYGLIAMGLGLMLGFLTRLSAFAGAVFLLQIYFSMPPWPGLPPNPLAEGHYMIVNKNLIEMLACLALACLPTGQWVGLDALLFGWRRRRREEAGPSESFVADPDTPVVRPVR